MPSRTTLCKAILERRPTRFCAFYLIWSERSSDNAELLHIWIYPSNQTLFSTFFLMCQDTRCGWWPSSNTLCVSLLDPRDENNANGNHWIHHYSLALVSWFWIHDRWDPTAESIRGYARTQLTSRCIYVPIPTLSASRKPLGTLSIVKMDYNTMKSSDSKISSNIASTAEHPQDDIDKTPGITTRDTNSENESDGSSDPEAQAGVQGIEAMTSVWSRSHLIAAYIM